MPVERSAMLGAQLWVVRWSPRQGVTAADVEADGRGWPEGGGR